MIYVFDLDDTLYDEKLYVKSGYGAVSEYLSKHYGLEKAQILKEMIMLLNKSRNGVFNALLKKYGILSIKLVKKCISVYRHHIPEIQLYPDAKSLLEKNIGKSMYLITDGNKHVQSTKIESLGIKKYFKKIILTSNYGLINAKPSPYCFLLISRLEHVEPKYITYIGDNPNKDFIGIKRLGFKTIRLLRGEYKDQLVSKEYEAHVKIIGYDDLLME